MINKIKIFTFKILTLISAFFYIVNYFQLVQELSELKSELSELRQLKSAPAQNGLPPLRDVSDHIYSILYIRMNT